MPRFLDCDRRARPPRSCRCEMNLDERVKPRARHYLLTPDRGNLNYSASPGATELSHQSLNVKINETRTTEEARVSGRKRRVGLDSRRCRAELYLFTINQQNRHISTRIRESTGASQLYYLEGCCLRERIIKVASTRVEMSLLMN